MKEIIARLQKRQQSSSQSVDAQEICRRFDFVNENGFNGTAIIPLNIVTESMIRRDFQSSGLNPDLSEVNINGFLYELDKIAFLRGTNVATQQDFCLLGSAWFFGQTTLVRNYNLEHPAITTGTVRADLDTGFVPSKEGAKRIERIEDPFYFEKFFIAMSDTITPNFTILEGFLNGIIGSYPRLNPSPCVTSAFDGTSVVLITHTTDSFFK